MNTHNVMFGSRYEDRNIIDMIKKKKDFEEKVKLELS